MPEFIAPDPNAEVMGFMVQAFVAALGEEGKQQVEKFGFTDIDPQDWYNLQSLFDLLKSLTDGTMQETFDLVKVGMRVSELGLSVMEMPPRIEEVFLSYPTTYDQMHRNKPSEKDFASAVQKDAQSIEFMSHNGYPCDLVWGTTYGSARLTRPENTQFSVIHRPGCCKKHGDDYCVYDIKWWEATDEEDN